MPVPDSSGRGTTSEFDLMASQASEGESAALAAGYRAGLRIRRSIPRRVLGPLRRATGLAAESVDVGRGEIPFGDLGTRVWGIADLPDHRRSPGFAAHRRQPDFDAARLWLRPLDQGKVHPERGPLPEVAGRLDVAPAQRVSSLTLRFHRVVQIIQVDPDNLPPMFDVNSPNRSKLYRTIVSVTLPAAISLESDLLASYGIAVSRVRSLVATSPRRSQLDSCFIERGTLQVKRLRRAAIIAIHPWNGSSNPEPKVAATPKEPRDPLKLARYYQSLLDSGKFESRAALARYLGVSRARVTQVLNRLNSASAGEPG